MCKYIYEFKQNLVTVEGINNIYTLDSIYEREEETVQHRRGLSRLICSPLLQPLGYEKEMIDYRKAWQIRMNRISAYLGEVPYFDESTPIVLDIKMKCPKGKVVDFEKWMEDSTKWLKDTFDISPDGKSNILSLVWYRYPDHSELRALVVPLNYWGEFEIDYSDRSYWGDSNLLSTYLKANHVEYLIDDAQENHPEAMDYCILKLDTDTVSPELKELITRSLDMARHKRAAA